MSDMLLEATEEQRLQARIKELEERLQRYEYNGSANLYYALQRKQNEMADLLNQKSLLTISLDDPKDKTFDRLKTIWGDAASLAEAVKALGASAGITGDEKKDVERKPFVDTIAERRH